MPREAERVLGNFSRLCAMRRAAKPDTNRAEIVSALRRVGASVYDVKMPVDLLVGYRGKTILMEIKRPGGDIVKKLTPAQREFIAGHLGGPVWIVTSVDEAFKALEDSV